MFPSRVREGLGVGQFGPSSLHPDRPTPDPSRIREGGD